MIQKTVYAFVKELMVAKPNRTVEEMYNEVKDLFPGTNPRWLRVRVGNAMYQLKRRMRICNVCNEVVFNKRHVCVKMFRPGEEAK